MKTQICNLPVSAIELKNKLVAKKSSSHVTIVDVDGVKIGGRELAIIAGPCAVENKDQLLNTAALAEKFGAMI